MNRRRFVGQAGALSILSAFNSSSLFESFDNPSISGARPSLTDSGNSWTLSNGLTAKKLWWDGERLHGVVADSSANAGHEAGTSEIYVYLAGQKWPGLQGRVALSKANHEANDELAMLELFFTAQGSPLEVSMRYVCRKNDPAIEEICRVRNTGRNKVDYLHRLDSCLLTIPLKEAVDIVSVHWVEGVHDDEKRNDEIYPTYRVSAASIGSGETVDFASGKWSSNEKLPVMIVQAGDRSYYAALAWSGEWNMNASHLGNYITVQAGLSDATITLQPDEIIESPASFYGVVQGAPAKAWNAIHDHCRVAIMPPVPEEFPWVTYNTWYNFGFNLHEDLLSEEAERAAKLGVEVFYIDDGWFEGSELSGKWGMGAGNWVENRQKFPNGISAFADHVHSLGMKFGLWVEPERLDAKLAGAIGMPAISWLATRQDQLIRWGFTDSDNETRAYQVCFGDPRARRWAIDSLSRMIQDYRVDWVKWDHNRYEVCQDWRHGHGSQNGDWSHTQGVWEVMAELRQRFPQLILENCAAGGHRFDFGMMRHTHVTWTSDQTSPGYVSRRHVYGASHPFPPQYLTSWYIPDRSDPDLKTLSPQRMDTLFRSHMLGAFGISDKLGAWHKNTTDSAMRSIALYKRVRRFLRGQLAWLTPQSQLKSPGLEEAPMWEATQMYLRDKGESVIFVFRAASRFDSFVLRPEFLRPGTYQIWDEDGYVKKRNVSTSTLIQKGIDLRLAEQGASAVLYIKEI